MSVMMRVDDETHKTIKSMAERDGRSITKEMKYLVGLAQQYEENRKKEDYMKSVAMDTFYEMTLWNNKKKMEREISKALRAQAKEKSEAAEETQAPQKNQYAPDTYEWYMEEALTRELTNEEVLRVNELSLIKEGWDPEAAHKKIYC